MCEYKKQSLAEMCIFYEIFGTEKLISIFKKMYQFGSFSLKYLYINLMLFRVYG